MLWKNYRIYIPNGGLNFNNGYGIIGIDKSSIQPFEPQINIKEERADVHCVMFSTWIGFYYNTSSIIWPNITIENKRKIIVLYDCGILFYLDS